jgi:excisionase family DNA binding protein
MSKAVSPPEPRIAYDLVEAAKQVCLSVDTLRDAVKGGQLPGKLVGRKYLIRHVDLVAWVDSLPSTSNLAA